MLLFREYRKATPGCNGLRKWKKSNDKGIFTTLFSESFKRTGYGHWLISDLSERFVDLRKVIVDFNMPAFIIFLCLSGSKSRAFVNILFSRFKMKGGGYVMNAFKEMVSFGRGNWAP